MPLQLRDNVHWCDCAGRAVFLDIEADRYFCLPAVANEAFMRLARGDTGRGDAIRLRQLVARRILVEDSKSRTVRRPPLIEPPDFDWLADPPPRPRLFPILQAFRSERRIARLLRTKPFGEVLDAVRREGPKEGRPRRDRDRSLESIAGASAFVSYLARVQDRCLVRALAVHALCRRSDIRPKLVSGVIAHPFAAHCWVQLGRAVLVGGLEQVRLYTPILVLE
jgi:hypothetical protein